MRRGAPVRRTLALFLVLLLAGCGDLSTSQSISPTEARPHGFAAWSSHIPAYHLNPGDRIRVEYLLTPELTEETVVGPDGNVSLPSAGQVMAAGETAPQLAKEIETASVKMLRHPVVTVALLDAAGARVYVGGAVQHPAAEPINGREGALEAILQAGGFNPEARMDEVVLIRRDAGNKPMLRTINLRRFVSGDKDTGDVPLYPGDIVFVPRSHIGELDLWIDQFINKVLPFSRSFDYTLNRSGPALF